MEVLKFGFPALIALVTMSFTVATNSTVFKKKVPVTNCYRTLNTGEWLQSCSFPAVFAQINKTNHPAEINGIVKNNLSVLNYISGSSVNCDGGPTFCCIQFTSVGTTNPCISTSNELNAPASPNQLKDDANLPITANDYVKIVDVFFKP